MKTSFPPRLRTPKEHRDAAWWKDDAPGDQPPYAEHLVALAAVMHDAAPLWCPRSSADPTAITSFDEEDDILHVGQLTADVWERARRSLARDGYRGLGSDGVARGEAIGRMLGVVVHGSRLSVSGLDGV